MGRTPGISIGRVEDAAMRPIRFTPRAWGPLSSVAAALALVTAACGGGATPAPSPAASAAPSAAASAAPSASAAASPTVAPFTGTLRIASSTWTGYAGLYIAQGKGFWKNHGLNVDYTDVEDPVQRLNALNGGQLDGMASTIDAFTRASAQGVPLVIVFPIDASVGGDGILAANGINSVADLKGKTVAVNIGSTSEWFLAQVLAQNGMSEKDVKLLNMTAGDAGAAFIAGNVPVAVTWEPWLSRAAKSGKGKVLVSSKAYPDLIVDAFAFRRDFVAAHPDAVANFIAGYFDAIAYWQQNQADANAIVAQGTKSDPAGVASDLTTIHLYTKDEAKTFMGTAQQPGRIYQLVKAASDFWKAKGDTTTDADVNATIDPSFLAGS
jgi:NitT/TauT family transport system substrate-binding protein